MRRRRPLLVVLGLVVVAIACGRLVSCGESSGEERGVGAEPSAAASQVPVRESEPAVVEGEVDGVGGGIDPAEVPGVLAAAERFARAWSDPEARQRTVTRLVTPELAAALTEPIPHPPSGPAYLLLDAPDWARAAVPATGGTIVLDLVRVRERWLVSALAWRGEGT